MRWRAAGVDAKLLAPMHEWMHQFVVWIFGIVRDGGHLGVFLLMAAESSILPVPSEVVIPPAAYWAGQGHLSFPGIIAAGSAGSWLGASVMYAVSRWLGRPLVVRYGRWVGLRPEKLERAERFLERYELGGIFFARLLPVVRHLIGIPAGIVRMRFLPYSAMTLLGSALWCSVLAWFGSRLLGAEPRLMEDPEALSRAVKSNMLLLVLGIALLAALYFAMLRLTQRRPTPPGPS
jgi:membrane protein DedA with SNARE-associated domain